MCVHVHVVSTNHFQCDTNCYVLLYCNVHNSRGVAASVVSANNQISTSNGKKTSAGYHFPQRSVVNYDSNDKRR